MEWNKVTWYSKILALAFFVALPFIGFYYGMQYGQIEGQIMANVILANSKNSSLNSDYYYNTAEWQVDQRADAGFTIAYPLDFETTDIHSAKPSLDWRLGANGTPGNLLFTLAVPKAFEPQSNFADAKLTVGRSASKAAVAQCLTSDQNSGEVVVSPSQVVGGMSSPQFSVFKSGGAGAGNLYETISYRT